MRLETCDSSDGTRRVKGLRNKDSQEAKCAKVRKLCAVFLSETNSMRTQRGNKLWNVSSVRSQEKYYNSFPCHLSLLDPIAVAPRDYAYVCTVSRLLTGCYVRCARHRRLRNCIVQRIHAHGTCNEVYSLEYSLSSSSSTIIIIVVVVVASSRERSWLNHEGMYG